jgi:hypothetical protein
LEEMRDKLSIGDMVSLVQKDGKPVTGELLRFGNVDLDIPDAVVRKGNQGLA